MFGIESPNPSGRLGSLLKIETFGTNYTRNI